MFYGKSQDGFGDTFDPQKSKQLFFQRFIEGVGQHRHQKCDPAANGCVPWLMNGFLQPMLNADHARQGNPHPDHDRHSSALF